MSNPTIDPEPTLCRHHVGLAKALSGPIATTKHD